MIVTTAQVKAFLGLTDPCQASGLLTVGQKYTVKVKGATGNFANVGTSSIEVGNSFYATGTIPTAWGGTILYVVDEIVESKISAIIPGVEADYERIRNVNFSRFLATFSSGGSVLSDIEVNNDTDPYLLDETDEIDALFQRIIRHDIISGAGMTGKVLSWDWSAQTITLDTAATAAGEGVLMTLYPGGADYVAALMVGYNLYKRHGLKSESTGGYSYTAEDMLEGYPKSIVGMIGRYVRVI
ncbi:MAG TPA: hypothetical protein VLM75_07570 [Spirochaetota bacterium]|nr:hypothetical protein [Spirochaetota bacterium]